MKPFWTSSVIIVFITLVSIHTTVAPPLNSITFIKTDDMSNTASLNNLKRKLNTRKGSGKFDQLLNVAIQALQNVLTTTQRPPDTTTCSNSVVVVNMAPVGAESFEPSPEPHAPPTAATPAPSPAPSSPTPSTNATAPAAPHASTAVMTSPGTQSVPPAPPTNIIIGGMPAPAVMTGASGGPSNLVMISPPATSVLTPSAIMHGAMGQAQSQASAAVISGQYLPNKPMPPTISFGPPPPTSILLTGPVPATVMSSSYSPTGMSRPPTINVGSTVVTAPAPSSVTVDQSPGSPSSITINKDPNSMIQQAMMVPRDPPSPSFPFGVAQREPLYPPRPPSFPPTYFPNNFSHG